jgi:glyoxylase-like metal-dependent hydrolase (beta-lactamase superfamily II)
MAVYGEAAFRDMYGDIVPIPAERVIVASDRDEYRFGGRRFVSVFTEGHARHHHCFHDAASASVFTGDSFGVSYRELDSPQGEFIYPTTTPIHFDPPEAHRAIETILGFEPKQLFLTHYSRVTDIDRLAADMHRRLDDFVAMAEKHIDDAHRTEAIHASMTAYFESELADHGFSGSPEDVRTFVRKDVVLNTMGLEYWLDHRH